MGVLFDKAWTKPVVPDYIKLLVLINGTKVLVNIVSLDSNLLIKNLVNP